jgi:DMSO/TMAO reductase YedYZ heme-binding membrane subunit
MGVADETSLLTVIGGGWGFALLFAMAATSNDASQKRLGKNWRRLHRLGIWTVWIIFAVTYFPGVPTSPIAAAASLALVAALLLRVWPEAAQVSRA